MKAQEGKWAEAIEKLEGYRKRYKPNGDHPEDPYMLRDLGEAYIGGRDSKDPMGSFVNAEGAYNAGAALMSTRMEFDKTLKPVYYAWVLRLGEIKIMQGDAATNPDARRGAYRTAMQLADTNLEDSGSLKEKFQKLKEEAETKWKTSNGKTQKAEPEKR